EKVKVKGNIHWVSTKHAYAAEVRLYDRLFRVAHPGRSSPPPQGEGKGGGGSNEDNWLRDLNPDSKKAITAQLEPALKDAKPEERFQFERHGYFVADTKDSAPGAPKFNRAVSLRDTWQ